MSSHPSHQLSEGADQEDSYTPYSPSDYAESRGSIISESADDHQYYSKPLSTRPDRSSGSQFSVKDLGVKAIDGHTSVHARPFSYNPSRQLPAVDPRHRPAYSLDSPNPKASLQTRETSWYLDSLEEEAPVAATKSVPSRTFYHSPRQHTDLIA